MGNRHVETLANSATSRNRVGIIRRVPPLRPSPNPPLPSSCPPFSCPSSSDLAPNLECGDSSPLWISSWPALPPASSESRLNEIRRRLPPLLWPPPVAKYRPPPARIAVAQGEWGPVDHRSSARLDCRRYFTYLNRSCWLMKSCRLRTATHRGRKPNGTVSADLERRAMRSWSSRRRRSRPTYRP